MRNPFSEDIFFDQQSPEQDVESLHADALRYLRQEVPTESGAGWGRALVVQAPRAGYGKTHLVTRFAEGLAGRAFVIPFSFDAEKLPRWSTLLNDMLEKLHRDHAHRPGLTVLDETARFLFARVNQCLIRDRKIPCAHPEEAVAALDRNYLEMFDFANPTQEVAKWFGSHFESLVQLSAEALAPQAGVEPDRAVFWLRVLCAYAQSAPEAPEARLATLRWAAHSPCGPEPAAGHSGIFHETGTHEQAAKDKVRDFGRLIGLHRPLVLVMDHLDVFYRDADTGLKLAYFISELRRLLPASLSVLSVNEDLWQTTFGQQLPSALEDRLTSAVLKLSGLTPVQAETLIFRRLVAAGVPETEATAFTARAKVEELFASRGAAPVSPRDVLRWAATQWTREQHVAASLPEVAVSPPAALWDGGDTPPSPFTVAREPAATPSEPPTKTTDTSPDVIPASSVVGADTLDSISEALEAMSHPAAAPPPSAVLWRLRERLDRLRGEATPAKTAKPAPQAASASSPGLGLHAAATASTAPSSDALAPQARAFLECLRQRTSSPVAPALDLERVGHLLRFVGSHSPAVKATELNVPGTAGQALQWISPDAEILVGLEASTRAVFWSALTAHAAARARLNGGVPVKVVGFVERHAPPHPARPPGPSAGYALDLIEPTPADLGVLAAACDLLDRAQTGEVQADPADLAALLAKELDPFWRRLTRLPTGALN